MLCLLLRKIHLNSGEVRAHNILFLTCNGRCNGRNKDLTLRKVEFKERRVRLTPVQRHHTLQVILKGFANIVLDKLKEKSIQIKNLITSIYVFALITFFLKR